MTQLTPDEWGALADLERDEADSGHPFAPDPDHEGMTPCGACGGWHEPDENCDLDDTCPHKAQKAFGGAERGGWLCMDCHIIVEQWDHRHE